MPIAKGIVVLQQITVAETALQAAKDAAAAGGDPTTQAAKVIGHLIDAQAATERAKFAAARSEDATDND